MILYIPNITIIISQVYNIEDKVKKLKPRYMGFLLYLYNPSVFRLVSSVGTPSLVDPPRLIRLKMISIKPIEAVNKEKIRKYSLYG